MKSIFLAVVSAGPSSEPVYCFSVVILFFFSTASWLFDVHESACSAGLKLTCSSLATHL